MVAKVINLSVNYHFLMNAWNVKGLPMNLLKMLRSFLRSRAGSQWTSMAFNINDIPPSEEDSRNCLFNFLPNPDPSRPLAMISLPNLPGFEPSLLKRSEHHYSRIAYLEMRSINLSCSDWTLMSTSLLFFLFSIHMNTYLLEHADALCDALANVH